MHINIKKNVQLFFSCKYKVDLRRWNMDTFKNFILGQVTYGTAKESNVLVKKNIQRINSITYGLTVTLIFIITQSIIKNNNFPILITSINLLLILANHLLFRKFKNVENYINIFNTLLVILTTQTLISAYFHGEGLVLLCFTITCIVHTAGLRKGTKLVILLLLIEGLVFMFHDRIELIYTYPPNMEKLFLRFFIIQLAIYTVTFFTTKNNIEIYKKAIEEKKSKERLFINMVHDLKTPLTIIHNTVDQCLYGTNNEKTKEQLRSNLYSMEKNVLNILNLNRLEKGFNSRNTNSVINISTLTNDICNSFSNYATSKNIILKHNIKNNLYVNIDLTSYTEILNNLIDNAIKYMNRRGEISITLRSLSSKVILTVNDNGDGISKSDITRIFEPYFQANCSYDQYYGLGIGLSIVKELCDQWAGKISVESNLGIGTSFKISFPKSKEKITENIIDNSSIPLYKNNTEIIPEEIINPLNEKKHTILIVEDNLELRNLLINNFKESYNLIVSRNGNEALKECSKDLNIDLIITDLMMPVMSGKEFIVKLREKKGYLSMPILILTAKSSNEDILEYLSLGTIDYICKPFSLNELNLKVESIISIMSNKHNELVENMGNDLISYISSNCNVKIQDGNSTEPDYKKLRDFSITDKELCMIERIHQGMSYKEIAYEEKISVNTVKTHIYRIYKKCKVNSFTNLVKLFYTY